LGRNSSFGFFSVGFRVGKTKCAVCAAGFSVCCPTFWRLAQWRISEYKTVNTPQKLMRG